MPIYRFHCSDETREPDLCGTVLPNDEAARTMAIRFAGELLNHEPERIRRQGQQQVEVMGEDGTLLFTVVTLAVEAPGPEVASDN